MEETNHLHGLLRRMAEQQRVVTLFVKGGERFHLKLIEIRGDVLIGEARGLYHNHEVGREMHRFAMEEGVRDTHHMPQGAVGLTMADAIEKFGNKAHRFRFFIDLTQVYTCVEDSDDLFDETPFFGSLL